MQSSNSLVNHFVTCFSVDLDLLNLIPDSYTYIYEIPYLIKPVY